MLEFLSWVLCQLTIVRLCKHGQTRGSAVMLFLCMWCSAPAFSNGEQNARLDFYQKDRTINVGDAQAPGGNRQSDGPVHPPFLHLKGYFANVAVARDADGDVRVMPLKDCGEADEDAVHQKYKDWVAVLQYTDHVADNVYSQSHGQCNSVLQRIQKAMLFGASAIILLVLNPKIARELDVTQLFSRPVVLVETAENITALLGVLARKIKLHVKISYKAPMFSHLQKVTMWSRCGRARPGSGIVCMQEESLGKVQPGQFWNYFYSAFLLLLLLLLAKARGGVREDDAKDPVEEALRRLAHRAVAAMEIRRYKWGGQPEKSDLCAVCLDQFYLKQRIRILPCSHQFHTRCVDPWLITRRTCPLCKHNIIDQLTVSDL